jgi:hypothetical protein
LILVAALGFDVFLAKRRAFRGTASSPAGGSGPDYGCPVLVSPAMVAILVLGWLNGLFQAEVLLHHSLGMVAVLLLIYINLVYLSVIPCWLAAGCAAAV